MKRRFMALAHVLVAFALVPAVSAAPRAASPSVSSIRVVPQANSTVAPQADCSATFSDGNVAINFAGPDLSCHNGGTCAAGESVSFGLSPYGWAPQGCETYEWSFGDGVTTTAPNPRHTFMGSNVTYTVTLTVANPANGSVGVTTIPVSINAESCDSSPSSDNVAINFHGTTPGCRNGGTCSADELIDFSLSPFGWTPAGCESYYWAFPDGTTATVANPVRFLSTSGQVVLMVENSSNGSRAVAHIPVNVGTSQSVTSGCDATVTDANVAVSFGGTTGSCSAGGTCGAGEAVRFNAMPSGWSAGGCETFFWQFGDGTTATGSSVTHAFSATDATYAVTLTVTNPMNGSAGRTNVPLKVFSTGTDVIADFSYEILPTTDGAAVTFIPSVMPFVTGTSVLWTFGDGLTISQDSLGSVTHTYAGRGSYDVSLRVTPPGGNTTVVTKSVAVGTSRPRAVRH